MLADALRAEGMRFLRQRGALFWGFGFFPALTLILALATAFFVRRNIHQKAPGAASVAENIFRNLHTANIPLDQLFVVLAAAALFASDYRWETWRLFTPRNSRANLLLGKLIVYALACLGGLVLLALSGLLQTLLVAAIDGSAAALPSLDGAFLSQLGLAFATAWLDLMLLGELALLVAVLTRSNIAAVIVPFALSCVQSFVMGLLPASVRVDPPLKLLLLMPSLSVDMLRGAPAPVGEATANTILAGAIVAGWLLALGGASIWLFRRQDLTRE